MTKSSAETDTDSGNQTTLILPRLGLGISGPLGTRLVGARHVQELVQASLEAGHGSGAGQAFFDTAPFYGLAQKRLGRALQGVPREDFVVSTKIGSRRQGWRMVKDWRPDSVARIVRRSLDELGVDYVDILFLHGCPAPEEVGALQAVLAQMHKAGWYRHLGLCARWEDQIDVTLQTFSFAAIMVPVQLHDREQMAKLEAWSRQHYQPIAIEILGAQAGALRPIRQPADLWYVARALALRLRSAHSQMPLAGHGETPALSASDMLTRALATPAISSVLTTTTRPAHWQGNLQLLEPVAF